MPAMTIRTPADGELPALQEIEVAAGRPFAAIGMALIADDPPPSLTTFAAYRDDGRAWIATDPSDRPIAFILADIVDGDAHITQVSVHPDHAHQRIGAALIEHVATWARHRGLPALTLTTFTDVPWNGPYYARLGFHPVPDADLPPELRAIRAEETGRGLDRWPRTAMLRQL